MIFVFFINYFKIKAYYMNISALLLIMTALLMGFNGELFRNAKLITERYIN